MRRLAGGARDVCPRCGRHAEFAVVGEQPRWRRSYNTPNQVITCLSCGERIRRCEKLQYAPGERPGDAAAGREDG